MILLCIEKHRNLRAEVKQQLTIEVLGIGFPNKGAELMLVAIQRWMAGLGVPSRIAVRWEKPFWHRSRFGLWGTVWHKRRERIPYGWVFQYAPRGVSARTGLLSRHEVDLFLDASGFAYGDPWPLAKAEDRICDILKLVQKHTKKLVFLPQSFGNFCSPGYQNLLREITNTADLIFARDRESIDEIESVVGQCDSVDIAPDYTSLVEPKPFSGMEFLRGSIAIIPNRHMYGMREELNRERYVRVMAEAIRQVQTQGEQAVLILHEGQEDRRLCEDIARAASGAVPTVAREDPCETKMAIGICKGVISSRYHGFASALYQSVPAVATSWSHKYEALAAQFGVPDAVVAPEDPDAICAKLFEMICSPNLQRDITERTKETKAKTRDMWKAVEGLIP